MSTHNKKLLLVGASGVIGQSILNHFKALADWSVLGVGRRLPDNCREEDFLRLDLLDRAACDERLTKLDDITHIIYAAVYEKPGALIEGWRDPDQITKNLTMFQNLMEPIRKSQCAIEHITLFQGSKAYGSHIEKQVPIPAKEKWPRHNHESFYWLQEDYIRERQPDSGWHYTILRPRIVFGGALGSNMNPVAAIGAYAAIQKYKGAPLHYPGGLPRINQATDADLIAEACAWAAESVNSWNQTFNIENGDVFTWQSVWPVIAEELDMPVGEPASFFLDELLQNDGSPWQDVVDRYQLQAPRDLKAFVGQSLSYTDFQMGTGKPEALNPVIVSTVKIRQAGFHSCIDTEQMFRKWFRLYRERQLLP
jgi:nucleoside-diphosphate-sugar epimerase